MKANGFSLIELVTVMVLIAVLAVFAAARFLGPSQFDTLTARDALVADLRRLQQAALAGQTCALSVTPEQFRLTGHCQQEGAFDLGTSTLLLGTLETFTLTLDNLGRPLNSCVPTNCASGCELTIAGAEPQTVCIESEGYVHGL